MQAEDRAHRIGQEHMVDVHYCIAEGSLDEKLFFSLNKKSKDTTGILDGKERCMEAEQRSAAPNAPVRVPFRPVSQAAAPSGPGGSCIRTARKRGPEDPHQPGIAKFFRKSDLALAAPSQKVQSSRDEPHACDDD